jgi:hypothetical protein
MPQIQSHSLALMYPIGNICFLNVAHVCLLPDASTFSRDTWSQGSLQTSSITNQPIRTKGRRLVATESERREGDVGDRFPISAWRY